MSVELQMFRMIVILPDKHSRKDGQLVSGGPESGAPRSGGIAQVETVTFFFMT